MCKVCYLCSDFTQAYKSMHSIGRIFNRLLLSLTFITLFSLHLSAQGGSSDSSVYVISILIIIGALILVSSILTLSENLIQIEAKKSGVDTGKKDISIIPSFSNLWKDPDPAYTDGYDVVHLDKGHDIQLNGKAEPKLIEAHVKRFAVRPPDYRGISPIPKVVVEVGQDVMAGDILFYDKKDDRVKFVSPVSGEVVEIRRGEKRAITDVIILADKKIRYKKLEPPSIKEGSREEIVHFLLESGGWTLINERPYDMLPDPDVIPQNIFISTFDSAPLAPDNDFIVQGKKDLFQVGVDVLARLTEGKVYLGLSANGEDAPNPVFTEVQNAVKRFYRGPHPSGNVGVQIHHTAPIRPGKRVWTVDVQGVLALGELFYKSRYHAERIVALTGACVDDPVYFKTMAGANLADITDGKLKDGNNRIIAGDVLTGRKVSKDDFLQASCDQITVIKEGDYFEMFGWLLPISPRPSISKSFPNFLFSDLSFDGDTNTHGEKRAFVVTGQYEQVLPMNIYPQHLIKAIMTADYEMMEGLGIHELTEEDIALCEFTCTSKMPLQKILRDGLNMMHEQS